MNSLAKIHGDFDMAEFKTRNNKIYNTLGVFLKRKKIENNHSLAKIFIDKFVVSEKKGWQKISVEELKEKKIIPSKKYKNFLEWKLDMIERNVLNCKASFEELKEDKPNYKANLFIPGKLIEKYINRYVSENIYNSLSYVHDKFDNKIEAMDNKFEGKIEELNDKFEIMMTLLLKAIPPDDEQRRNIIKDNFMDLDKCLMLLRDENIN